MSRLQGVVVLNSFSMDSLDTKFSDISLNDIGTSPTSSPLVKVSKQQNVVVPNSFSLSSLDSKFSDISIDLRNKSTTPPKLISKQQNVVVPNSFSVSSLNSKFSDVSMGESSSPICMRPLSSDEVNLDDVSAIKSETPIPTEDQAPDASLQSTINYPSASTPEKPLFAESVTKFSVLSQDLNKTELIIQNFEDLHGQATDNDEDQHNVTALNIKDLGGLKDATNKKTFNDYSIEKRIPYKVAMAGKVNDILEKDSIYQDIYEKILVSKPQLKDDTATCYSPDTLGFRTPKLVCNFVQTKRSSPDGKELSPVIIRPAMVNFTSSTNAETLTKKQPATQVHPAKKTIKINTRQKPHEGSATSAGFYQEPICKQGMSPMIPHEPSCPVDMATPELFQHQFARPKPEGAPAKKRNSKGSAAKKMQHIQKKFRNFNSENMKVLALF